MWFPKTALTYCHFFLLKRLSLASVVFSDVPQDTRQDNTKIRGSGRICDFCVYQSLWVMKFNTITQNMWYMGISYHFREQLCETGKCLCSLILLMGCAEQQEWLVITCHSIVLDWQYAKVEWKSVNLCRKLWFPGLGIRRKQDSAYPRGRICFQHTQSVHVHICA